MRFPPPRQFENARSSTRHPLAVLCLPGVHRRAGAAAIPCNGLDGGPIGVGECYISGVGMAGDKGEAMSGKCFEAKLGKLAKAKPKENT